MTYTPFPVFALPLSCCLLMLRTVLFSLFLVICAVLPSSAHSNPSSQSLEQHNLKRNLILKTIAKIHMVHYVIVNKISLTYPDNKLCRRSIIPSPCPPRLHSYGPSSLSSCIVWLTLQLKYTSLFGIQKTPAIGQLNQSNLKVFNLTGTLPVIYKTHHSASPLS